MRIPQPPLSELETQELTELLDQVAGRTLIFARGVFAAVATAPVALDPTEWLPLLLAQTPPDRASLQRLFELLVREASACAECLALGVPAVPSPDQADEVVEFCKGYVRLMQSVTRWTRDAQAFEFSVPFAVMAGYVGLDALRSFEPEAAQDPDAWRARHNASLSDDVAKLYAYWAEARAEPAPAPQASPPVPEDKVGRNDPCPCGSGKKFKKCCMS
ncbi:MAG: SEC-C metal-binding domain-containing protein [Myxococcales bacterium]